MKHIQAKFNQAERVNEAEINQANMLLVSKKIKDVSLIFCDSCPIF